MPGTHQNASAEGVQLAHTLYGTHVQGSGGVTHASGDIQPAGLHSTAPYRPPKRRMKDNPDKLLCSAEGCKAYPIKKVPYCAGHARKLGLVDWKVNQHDVDDR
jgi:hypothetical protein